jgi:hypothetical protein
LFGNIACCSVLFARCYWQRRLLLLATSPVVTGNIAYCYWQHRLLFPATLPVVMYSLRIVTGNIAMARCYWQRRLLFCTFAHCYWQHRLFCVLLRIVTGNNAMLLATSPVVLCPLKVRKGPVRP